MERKRGSYIKLMYVHNTRVYTIGGMGTPLILHISYTANVDRSNRKEKKINVFHLVKLLSIFPSNQHIRKRCHMTYKALSP